MCRTTRITVTTSYHGRLLLVLLISVLHSCPVEAGRLTIGIGTTRAAQASPVAQQAVADFSSLLQQAFPTATVELNLRGARIAIVIPETFSQSRSKGRFGHRAVVDRSYSWVSRRQGRQIVLRLQAKSPDGVACGLYGLLQERLGFRFHHPRESIIPAYTAWPLPERFEFSGRPRFEKNGFHLHTMHPTELAEQLLNPEYPGAFEDVARYIDWLARNGQNVMQYVLLRGVNHERWPSHATRIVDYAHRRGVRCGVQISLSMLQQQAFQAITLLRPYPGYRQQVDSTLAWLFRTPWDFISLEPTLGEHLPVLDRLLPEVQKHLEVQVNDRYGALLLLGTHVIGGENMPRQPYCTSSGILVHSVMCYSVTEPFAPVYGNQNQCFMLRTAQREQSRRETWYWPESSYWVGFDTPLPLLLLPYLDVRHRDSETMARLGVAGHLTFTSGWEWGYWLVDWSIARWTWQYRDNGRSVISGPLTPLGQVLPDRRLLPLWQRALQLQNHYLKEQNLMRFMAAATPFSELPHPFDKPFQPAPDFEYGRLLRTSTPDEARQKLGQPIRQLEEYAHRMTALSRQMSDLLAERRSGLRDSDRMRTELAHEMILALEVGALRARHRSLTLTAMQAKILERSGEVKHGDRSSSQLLTSARSVRFRALELVRRQEAGYRYPLHLLVGRRESMTAYPFGYLYPAGRLFFWEREEKQIDQGRFDPLFMNLWDIRRTLGLGSLLFR